MRTKTLNKDAVIKNINGLSDGDRAYCGPYGIVTCTQDALYIGESVVRNSRRFKVQKATKIANGGNYSMRALRKAITKAA